MTRGLIAIALLVLGGCAHVPVALRGRSSFEVLAPAHPAPPEGVDRQPTATDLEVDSSPGFFSAQDCPLPVYPAQALAGHMDARRLCVTVTFDETGTTTDVTPSWRGIPVQDRFSDDFFAAVKAAVMRWKITPPHLVYYRRAADGVRTYLRTEPLPDTEDIVFTFTTTGQVKAGR
ncbi:MAG TPA: hypothetical protein VMD31_02810 [Opitutaceae bacterium]|nr:hypothetical protein [Opitutaceae bacterium]